MNTALILILAFAVATALPAYDGIPPYPRKLPTPAELFFQAKVRNATKEQALKTTTESTTHPTTMTSARLDGETVTLQDANSRANDVTSEGSTEQIVTVAPVLKSRNSDEKGSGADVLSSQITNTTSEDFGAERINEDEIRTLTLEQATQAPLQIIRAEVENDAPEIMHQSLIPPLSLDSDTLFLSPQQKTVKKRFVLPGTTQELTVSGLLQNAIDIMYTFGWDTSGLQLLQQIYNSGFIQKHIELKRQFLQFILNILQFIVDKTGDYSSPPTDGYYPPAEGVYPPAEDVLVSNHVVQWSDDYLGQPNYQRRKRFVNLLDLSSMLDGSLKLLGNFGVDTSGLTLLQQLYKSGFAGGAVGFKKNLVNLMATSLSYALDFLPRNDEDEDDDIYDVNYPYPGRFKRFISFDASSIDIPKVFNGARDVVVGLGLDPSGVDFFWTMYNSGFVQKHLQFKKQVLETLVSTLQFIIRYFPQHSGNGGSITPDLPHSVDYESYNSHGLQTVQVALQPVHEEEVVLSPANQNVPSLQYWQELPTEPVHEPIIVSTPEVVQYEPTYTVHAEDAVPQLQVQPGTRFVPVNIEKVVPLKPQVGTFEAPQEDLHFSDENGHKIPHLVQVYPEESVPVYLVPKPEQQVHSQPYPPSEGGQKFNLPAAGLELPVLDDDDGDVFGPYPPATDVDTNFPPYPEQVRQLRKRFALFPTTVSFSKAFDQSISLLNFVGVDTSTLVFLKRLYQSGFAQKFVSFKTKVYELMVSTMNYMLGYYPSGILEQMFNLNIGRPQEKSDTNVTQATSIGAGGLSAMFENSGAFGSVLSTMINVFTNLNIDATTLLYLEALYNSPLASRLVFFQGKVYDMMMDVVDNMAKEVPEEAAKPNVEEQPEGGGNRGAQVGFEETDGGDGLQDTDVSELDDVGGVGPAESESDGSVRPQSTTTTTTETPKPYAPAKPYPGNKKYIPPLLPYPARFNVRFKEDNRRKRFAVQSKFSVDGLYTQVINLLDSLGIETSGLKILQRIHNSLFSYENLLFQRKIVNLISRICQFVLNLLPDAPVEVNQQLFSLDALLGKFLPTTTPPAPHLYPTAVPQQPQYLPPPVNPYPAAPIPINPYPAVSTPINPHPAVPAPIILNPAVPALINPYPTAPTPINPHPLVSAPVNPYPVPPAPINPYPTPPTPVNPYPTAPSPVVTQNPIKVYQEQVNRHILQNYLGASQSVGSSFVPTHQSQQLPVEEEDLLPYGSNLVEVELKGVVDEDLSPNESKLVKVKLNDTLTVSNNSRSKRNVAQQQNKDEQIVKDYVPITGDTFLYKEDGLQVGVVLGKGFEPGKVPAASIKGKRSITGPKQQDFEDTPETGAAGGGAEVLTEISIVHRVHEVTSAPRKQLNDYNNRIPKEWKGKDFEETEVPIVVQLPVDALETAQSKRSADEEPVQIVYPVGHEDVEIILAESNLNTEEQGLSSSTLEAITADEDSTQQPTTEAGSQTGSSLPQDNKNLDVSTARPEEIIGEGTSGSIETDGQKYKAPTVDVVVNVEEVDVLNMNLSEEKLGGRSKHGDASRREATNSANIISTIQSNLFGDDKGENHSGQAEPKAPGNTMSDLSGDNDGAGPFIAENTEPTNLESIMSTIQADLSTSNKEAGNSKTEGVEPINPVNIMPITPSVSADSQSNVTKSNETRTARDTTAYDSLVQNVLDNIMNNKQALNRSVVQVVVHKTPLAPRDKRHLGTHIFAGAINRFRQLSPGFEGFSSIPDHRPPPPPPTYHRPSHFDIPLPSRGEDFGYYGRRHFPDIRQQWEPCDHPVHHHRPSSSSEESEEDEGTYPPKNVKPDAPYPPADEDDSSEEDEEPDAPAPQKQGEKATPAVGFSDLPRFYVVKDFTVPVWYHGYKLGGAPITYLRHFNNGPLSAHGFAPDTQVAAHGAGDHKGQVDFNSGVAPGSTGQVEFNGGFASGDRKQHNSQVDFNSGFTSVNQNEHSGQIDFNGGFASGNRKEQNSQANGFALGDTNVHNSQTDFNSGFITNGHKNHGNFNGGVASGNPNVHNGHIDFHSGFAPGNTNIGFTSVSTNGYKNHGNLNGGFTSGNLDVHNSHIDFKSGFASGNTNTGFTSVSTNGYKYHGHLDGGVTSGNPNVHNGHIAFNSGFASGNTNSGFTSVGTNENKHHVDFNGGFTSANPNVQIDFNSGFATSHNNDLGYNGGFASISTSGDENQIGISGAFTSENTDGQFADNANGGVGFNSAFASAGLNGQENHLKFNGGFISENRFQHNGQIDFNSGFATGNTNAHNGHVDFTSGFAPVGTNGQVGFSSDFASENANDHKGPIDFNSGFASQNGAVDQLQTISSWYDDFKVPENFGENLANYHHGSFSSTGFASAANSFNSIDSGNAPRTNFNFLGQSFNEQIHGGNEGLLQTTIDFSQPQWFAAPESYDVPKLSPIEDFESVAVETKGTKLDKFSSSQTSEVNKALASDEYNSDLAAAIAQASPQIFGEISEDSSSLGESQEEDENFDEDDEDEVVYAVVNDVALYEDKDKSTSIENYTEVRRKNTGDFFKAKLGVEAQGDIKLSKGNGVLPLATKEHDLQVSLKEVFGHNKSSTGEKAPIAAHIAPTQNVVYVPRNASPSDVDHFVYPGKTSPYPYLQLVQDVVAYGRPAQQHASASENVPVVTSAENRNWSKKEKQYKFFLMPHYERNVDFRSYDEQQDEVVHQVHNFVVNSFTNALGDRLQSLQGPTFAFAPNPSEQSKFVEPTLIGRFGASGPEQPRNDLINRKGSAANWASNEFSTSTNLNINSQNSQSTVSSTPKTLVTHPPRKERLHQYNSFKVLPHFSDGKFEATDDSQGLVQQNVVGGQGNQNSINVNIFPKEVVKVTDKGTQTEPEKPINWVIKSRSQTTTRAPTTTTTPKTTTIRNRWVGVDSSNRGDVFDYSDVDEAPSSPKYKWVLVTKEPPIIEPQDESLYENFLNTRPEKSIRQIGSEMVDDLVDLVSTYHHATSEPTEVGMGKRLDSDVKKREVPESEEMSVVAKDIL